MQAERFEFGLSSTVPAPLGSVGAVVVAVVLEHLAEHTEEQVDAGDEPAKRVSDRRVDLGSGQAR